MALICTSMKKRVTEVSIITPKKQLFINQKAYNEEIELQLVILNNITIYTTSDKTKRFGILRSKKETAVAQKGAINCQKIDTTTSEVCKTLVSMESWI